MGNGDTQKIQPLKTSAAVLIFLFSAILSICTEAYIILCSGSVNMGNGYKECISDLLTFLNSVRLITLFIVIAFICFMLYFFGRQIGSFIYRFRWPIGIGIIILAVIFEISGTSIGMWKNFMPDGTVTDDGIILGQSRPIRSDEWAVHTPMTLSQYYGGFPVFGDIFRGSSTDMYMVYGQPVMDWSIIFRPFQIGYLFLSPAKGMAFYWVGKLVMLVLVSFEMGMLITKKNKLLSLTYAAMMAFAPVVQWWFGANSFPEMLIYGQGIILCVAVYMHTSKYWQRILCGLGFIICGGAYILVMYPAWQIPFFYVFLLVGIWVIIERRKEFKFSAKKDIPIIAGSAVIMGICIIAILIRSWETIQAVMNSVYPGDRAEIGGGGLSLLFKYPGNAFLQIDDGGIPSNQSELSSFFDLFPIGLIISLLVIFKDKVRDKLLIFMWILELFLGAYVILGFPELLAKITLLSNSQTGRAVIALLFVNIIILIRSIAIRKSGLKIYTALPVAVVLAVAMTYYSKRLVYGEYFNKIYMIISIAALSILFFLALLNSKRMRSVFCVAMCLTMLFVGGLVNPVRSGFDIIDNNRIGQAIRNIQAENSGVWIAENEMFMDGNFIAMNGAPALNTTNTYCNAELWEKIDPTGQYEDIYNRYAHITIKLNKDTPTTFELLGPDHIKINLNVNDLDVLGIDYILTVNNLEELNTDECSFNVIYSEPDISRRIYEVKYGEQQ